MLVIFVLFSGNIMSMKTGKPQHKLKKHEIGKQIKIFCNL